MSLVSWKKEFFPTNAWTKKALARPVHHSLKKWRGLMRSNLKKHGVLKRNDRIGDDISSLDIDSTSCALCYLHLENNCLTCPIYMVQSRRCDSSTPYKVSEYADWKTWNDPTRMIKLLEKAIEQGYK